MQQHESKWDFYRKICFKYHIAPIEQIRQCLDGKESDLNLSHYIPRTLGTQLIFEVLIQPPQLPLKSINLSYSPFNQYACEYLSDFMEESTTLEHLNLSFCGIGFEAIQTLRQGIYYCECLIYLNLTACNLSDAGGAVVANALLTNEICQFLDLSHNELFVISGKAIGKMLQMNNALQTLKLGWNNLYLEECIVPLLKGLVKNQAVKLMDLSWNGLSGELFAKTCRAVFRKNRVLEEINLEFNRITGAELKPISVALKKGKGLKMLHLAGNPLSMDDIKALLKSLQSKNKLNLLSFGKEKWLNADCVTLIAKINQKFPALQIIYRGTFAARPLKMVNYSELLMNRSKYLAAAPKKRKLKKNMGHFCLKMLNDGPEYCTYDEFMDYVMAFKLKLDKKLIEQIMRNWTETVGKKKKAKQRVAVHKMAKFYLELHPTENPPPVIPKKITAKKGGKARGKKRKM